MNREEFNAKIHELLLASEALIPKTNLPDLPFMDLAPTVHEWYDFEHQLWAIGEEIRQLTISENKDFGANHADRICKICLDTRAKRGRQSFILLLGKKKYSCYADRIISVLSDDDICGHVINTVYKMGAFQYVKQIKPYTYHALAWIRNEAKRYVQKHSS